MLFVYFSPSFDDFKNSIAVGATGFIGSAIVQELMGAGQQESGKLTS